MTKNMKSKQKNLNINGFADFILPCIHITSNNEAVIDGCKGVIEYHDKAVRINCSTLILKFTGSCLSIKTETTEQYIVTGDIATLEFCSC